MDECFRNEEKLYRAVCPPNRFPNFWKKSGKISSAALKDSRGLSVERGNFRPDAEVLEHMMQSLKGNVIFITVGQCREVDAVVKYLPSVSNIYHSEIHDSENEKCLTDSQAKHLADLSILI